MHTLMKGMAKRLETLVQQVSAPLIIIMEGDATPVANFPSMILKVEELLKKEDCCWRGYFTSARPNRVISDQHEQERGDLGPLFFGDCSAAETYPD